MTNDLSGDSTKLRQPWRKAPVITVQRAEALARRRRRSKGRYHYRLAGLALSRADVEWLVAEQAATGSTNGLCLIGADLRGLNLSALPLRDAVLLDVDLRKADLRRASLAGADLSTADLRGVDCRDADLARADLRGARLDAARLEGASLKEANLAEARLPHAQLANAQLHSANLEGTNLLRANLDNANLNAARIVRANLLGASLQGCYLQWGQAQGARLTEAVLRDAVLWAADLRGAHLAGARLDNANLHDAGLEGADLTGACLQGTILTSASFDTATILRGIDATGHKDRADSGVTVVDVHWNEVNLAVIKWSDVEVLGDEVRALHTSGHGENEPSRAEAYARAARANRQVAMQLQGQGMSEEANRFTYRAQIMQRRALRYEHKRAQYLFSLLLSAISGYGYRFGRGLAAYLLVVLGFAVAYVYLAPVDWTAAFVASVNAFHGRGFQPDVLKTSDLLWLVSAAEAFLGLVIEVVLVATLTQRLFGR
jgi:uncharacterized protein YjbI with pentapeptide repeats